MPWQEVRFQIQRNQLEMVEAELESLAALSVSLQDAGDQPLLEPLPGSLPLWDAITVVALFEVDTDLGSIKHSLLALTACENWEQVLLPDQDWERSWMDQFEPIQIGSRLWVCPSWKTPPDPAAVNLSLDPGLAFGSGTHPTTHLCLQWLDANQLAGAEVIDYGCGSGILGLAALLLGAEHVTGIDLDQQALTASRNNAIKNGISDSQLTLCYPTETDIPVADILVANILSGPLISLASSMAMLTKDNGTIILSGILVDQADTVKSAYSPWFIMQTWETRDGWVCIIGRKQSRTISA